MSRNTVIRQELLGRLGLEEGATDQEVEAAHNGLVDFLELAPHEVKSWAATQTVDVDEAFALLSGPEQDLTAVTQMAVMAQEGLGKTSPVASPAPATPRAPVALAAPSGNKPPWIKLLWVAVPVLVIAVVLAVFQMGKSDVPGISGTPTGTQTTAAGGSTAAPLDQAKVGALMQKITANPKDLVSLAGLGDLYFAASDYKNATVFEQKVLDVAPKNEKALVALGAAQFNLGNGPAAKKVWLIAAGLYPKSIEVHYDLGFYYMSQKPPDTVNMTAEWKKVVAIDPNSAAAKSVSTHVKGTKTPAPSATPTK